MTLRTSLLIILLSVFSSLFAQKRTYVPSARDTSVKLLVDDPISAALDSLAYLKLFETARFGSELGRNGSLGISQVHK